MMRGPLVTKTVDLAEPGTVFANRQTGAEPANSDNWRSVTATCTRN